MEERCHNFGGGVSGRDLIRSELHMYCRRWRDIQKRVGWVLALDVATAVERRSHDLMKALKIHLEGGEQVY